MNLNFSKIMPQQAHSKRTWKDRLPYLLAFFIPALSMIMIFIGKEIYPFGDRSFLRTDLYHQYAPFFQELKDKLANGESLFYTWDIGLGIKLYGNICLLSFQFRLTGFYSCVQAHLSLSLSHMELY